MQDFKTKLRIATADDHRRTEDGFAAVLAAFPDSYGDFLVAHARAFPAIGRALSLRLDWAPWRARWDDLEADLAALDLDPPPALNVSAAAGRAEALGMAYVLEGFTVLALVFHELTTNAAKYGALSDNGRVKVSWHVDDTGSLLLTWRESGGPAVIAPTRRGFGSTLIERSIPFELGGTAALHYRVAGIEAEFCIPSRHLAGTPTGATPSDPVGEGGKSQGILAGMHVLLIEDSMLIALTAEDALRELGAKQVTVAPTAAAAKKAIDTELIDFAVLDFNLGNETSLPIAEELVALGLPVVMATGYGTDLDLPPALSRIPVVTKPYDQRSLAPKIAQAMRS